MCHFYRYFVSRKEAQQKTIEKKIQESNPNLQFITKAGQDRKEKAKQIGGSPLCKPKRNNVMEQEDKMLQT